MRALSYQSKNRKINEESQDSRKFALFCKGSSSNSNVHELQVLARVQISLSDLDLTKRPVKTSHPSGWPDNLTGEK